MSDLKLNFKRVWTTQYRGILIEINHWGTDWANDGKGVWNYYIFLNEHMFEDGVFKKHFWLRPQRIKEGFGSKQPGKHYQPLYKYMHLDFDFHGGATYYQKIGGVDGGSRQIQIGCDYNHV